MRSGAALLPWLGIAVVIAVLDQLTKSLASHFLSYGVPRAVVPGFNLTLLHNTGAAFSLFHDQPGWQRWFFIVIAVVVGGGVAWWLTRLEPGQRWAPLALALVLGGACGNLVDRVLLGYVVDFIQVYYQRWSWPAFNVADSAISVGAVMLILRGPRQTTKGDE
ncbi:MAG: signal peptidase II [Gammaproteobacteria bacterium]